MADETETPKTETVPESVFIVARETFSSLSSDNFKTFAIRAEAEAFARHATDMGAESLVVIEVAWLSKDFRIELRL